jgi:integrase
MARINLPTGQRKTVYGATRGEAIRKLREVQHLVDDGVDVPTADVTLEKYLAGWLLAIEPTVRPGTFRRYEQLVRNQLIPELGRVRLSKLTAIRLQAFYALWLKRGLSTTSVRHLHTVLHRALKQAVRWGVATRNVAALVDPPKMRRLEFTVLSGEQARALLCAAAGERFEALYVLALSTGMRQGELLGLR